MRLRDVVEESLRAAWAQRVPTALVAVLCAALSSITLLTVGRAAAAEAQVISRLDTAGSRLLVISDDKMAGLVTPTVLTVLTGVDTIERVVGFDDPFDVFNDIIGEGGTRTPAWITAGPIHHAITLTAGRMPNSGEALVSTAGQQVLGLAHPAGVIADSAGRQYPVVGSFVARSPFEFLSEGAVVAHDGVGPVRSIHVVTTTPSAAKVTENVVLATLAPADSRSITVRSPTTLADLQGDVSGDLAAYGRGLIFITLGGGGFLITVVILAEVLLRRRDLGRRRALGAPRWGLIALVVARTTIAAIPGILFGIAIGIAASQLWAQRPPWDFTAGTAFLALLTAVLAATPPAVIAAWRDPVGVLRMP